MYNIKDMKDTYINTSLLMERATQGQVPDSPELWSLGFFMLIIASFIFLGIAGLFLWRYWANKNDSSLMDKYGDKSAGSFKGYWARYRGAVYAFCSAMFILFGVLMFLFAFGVISAPYTDII